MTTRDIEQALVELYGVTVSHTVISQVTDAILDEVRAWQNRPLDAIYPIVWLDGLVIKAHHGKQVVNKTAYVVLGVNLRGEKDVLGLWIAENEGTKFWLSVLTELKARGVQDIYIACMDGLKGWWTRECAKTFPLALKEAKGTDLLKNPTPHAFRGLVGRV